MQSDLAISSVGYANQTLDTTRVQGSISRLDMTAGILAAIMALAPLAMAAYGAHFGA